MSDMAASPPPGKKIVIFADGTGNAFSHQESNVWRLYSNLDQTGGEQIARYIPGVGTQSIGLLAKLDGAIGFGVPGNVRELYRFICWNWEPGDEIHLVGFSRGAFTVRTLASMIEHEGLLPREIGNKPVSHEDMQSASAYAWRAYRAKTTGGGFASRYFLVALGRAFMNLLRARSVGRQAYERARNAMECSENRPRKAPPIRFMGVFDTVEAYGVPFEELKPFVDCLVFPIRFRTKVCSALVENVSHALALNDERTAFHPVRFDQGDSTKKTRITEVWFAGMHSDVGGGYPDDTLACIPLVWMAQQGVAAGLRFQQGALDEWEEKASPRGEMHDSRAGLSVIYRYAPRRIDTTPAEGGLPVLHYSVAEKIVDRSTNYAPLNVPDQVRFLVPPRLATPKALPDTPEEAVKACPAPNKAILESARDVVWWRQVHYFVLVFLLATLAAFPWLFDHAREGISLLRKRLIRLFGEEAVGMIDEVALFFKGPLEFIGTFLPAMARPWVEALIASPVIMIALIYLAWWMYKRSGKLQKMIHDYAVLAWRAGDDPSPPHKRLPSMDFARTIRNCQTCNRVFAVISTSILPTLVTLLALLACFVLLSRNTVDALTKSGRLCHNAAALDDKARSKRLRDAAAWPPLVAGKPVTLDAPFDAVSPCWATGITVTKGVTYQLTIRAARPFLDHARVSPLTGFVDTHLLGAHGSLSSLIFKRWRNEPWFQFSYQIGANDLASGPLRATNGLLPARNPPLIGPSDPGWNRFEPYTSLAQEKRREVERRLEALPPPAMLVTRFRAGNSGPLYLYLNDAMIGIPVIGIVAPFYRNNAGRAEIQVEIVNGGSTEATDSR